MKLSTKKRYQLIRCLLVLKRFSVANCILIFSEARSGSTWLMELISQLPNSTINWEPLHVERGVVPRDYRLGWRPNITIENHDIKFKKLFKEIITFKRSNNWSAQFVKIKSLLGVKYVITKYVRANMSLNWFVHEFGSELRFKPILLLRHPITTCFSRMQKFERIKFDEVSVTKNLKAFQIPDCINNSRFIEHKSFLDGLETMLELEIAIWCINNSAILNSSNSQKWCLVHYEDLVMNTESTLSKLLNESRLVNVFGHFEFNDRHKASVTSLNRSKKINPKDQIGYYLTLLSTDYLDRIQIIFDYFNITMYEARDPLPKRI